MGRLSSHTAPHVRRLNTVIHSYEGEPTVQTLLWSPTVSWFSDGKGNWRQIWGLERREAEELCRLKSVDFRVDFAEFDARMRATQCCHVVTSGA